MTAHAHPFSKRVFFFSVFVFGEIHIRDAGSSCCLRCNQCPLWLYTFSFLVNLK